MQKTKEMIIRSSDELRPKRDEIIVGGIRCVIVKKTTNDFGQYVLQCGIVGARVTKKRNHLTLIIPDQTPVITYV